VVLNTIKQQTLIVEEEKVLKDVDKIWLQQV
jgi:hypothetical protein